MATRNFVPRANFEGKLGTAEKNWQGVYARDLFVENINGGGVNAFQPSESYSTNDIIYTPGLASNLQLECAVPGTAGATAPDVSSVSAGDYVTSGTAVFIATDKRDGFQVGDIKLSPILRPGYVKANGAQLSQASVNYPRLITFVTDNPSLLATDDTAWASNKALYVYDSVADTLRVPDATGRFLQGGSNPESKEAGLPNISGYVNYISANDAQAVGSGALSWGNVANVKSNTASLTGCRSDISFNASTSNSIYGGSTTVQPSALTLIPQIKY